MCDWWGWIKCLLHSLIPSNCQKDSRTDSAFICHLCCDDDEHEEAAVFPVCSSPINPYLDVWKRSSAIRRDHFIKTTNSFNLHKLPVFMLCAVCMGKPALCCVFSELNWDWHNQSIWKSELCSSGAWRFVFEHRSSSLHWWNFIRLHLISQIYKRK